MRREVRLGDLGQLDVLDILLADNVLQEQTPAHVHLVAAVRGQVVFVLLQVDAADRNEVLIVCLEGRHPDRALVSISMAQVVANNAELSLAGHSLLLIVV